MPELPEVEVIARGLNRSLPGRTVERVEVPWPTSLRQPEDEFRRRMLGARVLDVRRRAKLLLADLESPDVGPLLLGVHLKMTGRLVHECGCGRPGAKHDRVIMTLDDGSVLTFADVRRFGYIVALTPDELNRWPFYASLGPEPLESSADALARAVASRKARIKALLLDQTVLAGCGNIYADESLFRAGLGPAVRACDVPEAKLVELFRHLQDVLAQAIAENGSSIRDYVNADGDAGAFQNSFNVYGKKGQTCPRCGGCLTCSTVAGRTSTYCPDCQKNGR
jgi:formamidopyrimidine-DNA glycosylase